MTPRMLNKIFLLHYYSDEFVHIQVGFQLFTSRRSLFLLNVLCNNGVKMN